MTSLSDFKTRCKMRYDFGDMIQVRYHHTDGEHYDTWVSGDEVLQRMKSSSAEERLREQGRLDWQTILNLRKQLPALSRSQLEKRIKDLLGEQVEELIGGNVIGDSLAASVRSPNREDDEAAGERALWLALLHKEAFRAKVLELAWIHLDGSFPQDYRPKEPDDWL